VVAAIDSGRLERKTAASIAALTPPPGSVKPSVIDSGMPSRTIPSISITHWLRHSPLVLLLGLMLVWVALGLIASGTTWPSTSDRGEILAALGSIAGAALLLISTSLTRIFGQTAFASMFILGGHLPPTPANRRSDGTD
jgi:hypothetical protein